MEGLLEESSACAESDGRYIAESDYLDYLDFVAKKELVKF